ncbi:MAG: hypothetical protein ACLQDA_03360 [Terracidiphilus sp.]
METVALAAFPSATPPKFTEFGDVRSELELELAAGPIIVPPRQPHIAKGKLHEKKTKMKRKSDENSRFSAAARARESAALHFRRELQADAADTAVELRLNGAQKRMSRNRITL